MIGDSAEQQKIDNYKGWGKKSLTQKEVDLLENGTKISVKWSGGNEGLEYFYFNGYAAMKSEIEKNELDISAIKGRCLDFCGKSNFHTNVYLR